MRWFPASLLLASMATVAAVPYSFPVGMPAKATQVNRNFELLDSLLTLEIEQFADLRLRLTARVNALRRDVDSLQGRSTPAPSTVAAPDTSWKTSALPVGVVLGLTTAPGPDGFLPGSQQTWQSVEAFGGIGGLPVVSKVNSAAASAAKPVFRWYVKVK